MKRILLSRTDAIGDLILTLPVVRSIKEQYPDYHLTMLVSEYTKPLLDSETYIDQIITIQNRSVTNLHQMKELTSQMMNNHYDAVVYFYPRLGLSFCSALAGINECIGTAYRAYSFLFSHQVKIHRKESGKHELDLNYQLAEDWLGNLPKYEPSLSIPDSELKDKFNNFENKYKLQKDNYVLIHPLSAGSAPNWSLNNYMNLTERLSEKGITIVITGSKSEAEIITSNLVQRDSSIINLAGKTSLRELMVLINQASVVVCGSSGPIHIANALGTYAIGLYPSKSTISPTRWAPRGGANKLFIPAVNINDDNVNSLESISVDEVASFLLSKLQDVANL